MTRSNHSSTFFVDWIYFILTGNKDIYKILYEFEIWHWGYLLLFYYDVI